MITDSQMKMKRKGGMTEEIEKNEEEKLDASISNHEIGFVNFLRFTTFTILVTCKSFVIRPYALVLRHSIKRFTNL